MLGTLHTNTAAAAIPRLINLGVPHYYVADVLRAVLSQRLVRATCRACGQPVPIPETLRQALPKLPETERIGRGCPACYQGYVGRLPIGELLVIDDEISARITAQVTALEIQHASNAPTLLDNGIEQIRGGHTTTSEVLREALWANGIDAGQPPSDLPGAAVGPRLPP